MAAIPTRHTPRPKPRNGSCGARRIWRQATYDGFSLLRATYSEHRFAVHSHGSWVFGTNLKGSASCFENPALTLTPGAIGVVPPGVPHGGHRVGERPWLYLAVYPTRELVREIFEEVSGRPAAAPSFERRIYRDPEMAKRFVAAHRAAVCGSDPLYGESAIVDFLMAFVERYGAGRPASRPGSNGGVIARSIDYIRAHLDEPLSLEDLARTTGYSRFHFLRLFKRRTGQTPHAFVMQERVERAKELLKAGLPIASSAHDAGFADQPHLTRRFKQLVGVTPGEFVRGIEPVVAAGA